MVKAPDFDSGIRRFESYLLCQIMVNVAQLVEPRIVIPVVAGSSPVIHPNMYFKFWSSSSMVRAAPSYGEGSQFKSGDDYQHTVP